MSSSFQVGGIVWIKIEGFPWWPAKIVDDNSESLSNSVKKVSGRKKKKKN